MELRIKTIDIISLGKVYISIGLYSIDNIWHYCSMFVDNQNEHCRENTEGNLSECVAGKIRKKINRNRINKWKRRSRDDAVFTKPIY